MKFAIITHVRHTMQQNQFFGYAPYIQEMNIWLKHVSKVILIAPLQDAETTKIDAAYIHSDIDFREVTDFNLTTITQRFLAFFKFPLIVWNLYNAMKSADHIHLRCPGNVGLLGCFVQILFPGKAKTAKYAGNWDPKAQQPWTYKLQKYILSNTFLTRNMQVLVYGEWENQSKNIKPFFTASYSESERQAVEKTGFDNTINFMFAGTLVTGKNPLYALKVIHKLIHVMPNCTLNFYGEGPERVVLENYIRENRLENHVFLHGNQNKETLKAAYKQSHFVILPSKSEGWPKAIAEGMFWGCVPIATQVSCVPYMLDFGSRGVLLNMDLEQDASQIASVLNNKVQYDAMVIKAVEWSQHYTIDLFETEIQKILKR